jgi:hypothetical protein
MVEAVQIKARSAQPPDVPLEIPRFQWPPPEEGCSLSSGYSTEMSNLDRGSEYAGRDGCRRRTGHIVVWKWTQQSAPESHRRAFTGGFLNLSHCASVPQEGLHTGV